MAIKIVEVVGESDKYERFLYRCLAPHPFRRYRKRTQYLEMAAPRGLRKEVLFMDEDAVGQIEYAPVEASGYPISGDGVWVMNCIWVLRRAKGHRFGKMLARRMLDAAADAAGFATVGLEDHPSPWLRLHQMEYLGFRSLGSAGMRHKVKRPEVCFKAHLMWMPVREDAEPPVMDWKALLKGVDFCIAHPLYRAERLGLEEVYEEC